MEDKDTFYRSLVNSERLQLIEKVLERRTRQVTLVLEDLYNPHNISAILRSAEAYGIQDLHILEKNNSFKTSKGICKSSDKWLSLNFYSESSQKSPLDHCLEKLREHPYKLITLSPHAPPLDQSLLDPTESYALLLGAEKNGLSSEAFKNADINCSLPMEGFIESFNVSVAAALCMEKVVPWIKKNSPHWELSSAEKEVLRSEWIKKSVNRVALYEKAFEKEEALS